MFLNLVVFKVKEIDTQEFHPNVYTVGQKVSFMVVRIQFGLFPNVNTNNSIYFVINNNTTTYLIYFW